jgi:hypothetical protein
MLRQQFPSNSHMSLTPRQLIEQINTLSDEYFKLAQEMAGIAERSGTAWLELRKQCKTNAETDQQWQATADGRRENYLKWYLRGLEKKRGALVLEHQMNNQQ